MWECDIFWNSRAPNVKTYQAVDEMFRDWRTTETDAHTECLSPMVIGYTTIRESPLNVSVGICAMIKAGEGGNRGVKSPFPQHPDSNY